MINFLYQNFSRNLQLFLLRLGLGKKKFKSFKDLNFKQNDFINYKIIKYYVLKENFINNLNIQDIHTFNFLFFYQKIGGKKGIELSKKNIFLWFKKFKYYKNFTWTTDIASKRFINLLYNYDFICSISNTKEVNQINGILNFHIKRINFEIDPFKKKCLLNGLDDIALSLEKSEKISSYESKIEKSKPWIN